MLVLPVIRLANTSDARPIAEMSRNYIEEGLGWSWRDARVLRAIRDETTNVAVVDDGESIVGFGIMQYRDETAHLTLFAVRPSHRRRGLGSGLLAWLEKPARVAGVERLRVEARADRPEVHAVYRRVGFELVKTIPGYYSGVVDGVQFEKRLISPP